jgi:hypothetical protein
MDDCCESDPSFLGRHYSFRFRGVNSRDRATSGMSCPLRQLGLPGGAVYGQQRNGKKVRLLLAVGICTRRSQSCWGIPLPFSTGPSRAKMRKKQNKWEFTQGMATWTYVSEDPVEADELRRSSRLNRLIPEPAYRSSDLLHESSSASAIGHSLAQEIYAEMKGGNKPSRADSVSWVLAVFRGPTADHQYRYRRQPQDLLRTAA